MQVRTAMEPTLVYLMPAGVIRGFVEVLALPEALVVAGAEAAADSDFGGKLKLSK